MTDINTAGPKLVIVNKDEYEALKAELERLKVIESDWNDHQRLAPEWRGRSEIERLKAENERLLRALSHS